MVERERDTAWPYSVQLSYPNEQGLKLITLKLDQLSLVALI